MRSKPYHEWARLSYTTFQTDGSITGLPHSGHVYPIGNTFRENQPDDLVERVFMDVTVSGTIRPRSTDDVESDLWPGGMILLVCASVTSIGSGAIPDPTDAGGPNTQTVITGKLTLDTTWPTWNPRSGFQTGIGASWSGRFESQGSRLSPLLDTGPAVQGSLWVGDQSAVSAGEPFAPVSSWSVQCYLRALFASRLPY